MKQFWVTLVETRERTFCISAETNAEAEAAVEDMYFNDRIELSLEDAVNHKVTSSLKCSSALPEIDYGNIRLGENKWQRCTVNTKTKEVYGFAIPDNAKKAEDFLLYLNDGIYTVCREDMKDCGCFWTKVK